METVLIALVCVGLIFFAVLTLSQVSMSSTEDIATAWQQRENTSADIAATTLASLDGEYDESGFYANVTLQNDGNTSLEDFEQWDVILQYHAHASDELLVKRMDYTDSVLAAGQWTVEGIYLDAGTGDPEVFDPGIFNPDEEIIIRMMIDPKVNEFNSTSRAIVAAPNGVTASTMFSTD